MYAWEAIQKALDYIEGHLDEEMEVEALARAAALSPFYFQKLFSRLVKKPLREYIKLRRLNRSCELLKARPEGRILDIAMDSGFGSHENFSRVFKEAYGLTPEQYRARPVFLNQFDKPDLPLQYVVGELGAPVISEGLVLEMNWRTLETPLAFMGLSAQVPIAGQMPLGEATGVDIPGALWTRFHEEKGGIPRLPGGRELGVAFMGQSQPGYFTYFVGAETAGEARQKPFETWQLPPREYLVCAFEAESFEDLVTTALNKAVKYSQRWMEAHDLHTDLYAPELYYPGGEEGAYMELWSPVDRKA